MFNEATEEEDRDIIRMRNEIIHVMRLNDNRNIGVSCLMQLLIQEFHEAHREKESFLKDLGIAWDYYDARRKKPKYSSHQAKLVEQLFRGF